MKKVVYQGNNHRVVLTDEAGPFSDPGSTVVRRLVVEQATYTDAMGNPVWIVRTDIPTALIRALLQANIGAADLP